MVPPDRLVILHAPGHAPDVTFEHTKEAIATEADSIAYSEWYKEIDNLRFLRHFRTIVAKSTVDTRAVHSSHGDAGDNPICVRRPNLVTRLRAYKADDASQGTARQRKNGPERWVYVVDYTWAGQTICHISAHPSPLFVGKLKWLRVMRLVQREVRKAYARGCLPIVTGDLQTGLLATNMLKGVALNVWRDRIDFIAYSPDLLLVDRKTWKPAGMDHFWLLGTFVYAPNRV